MGGGGTTNPPIILPSFMQMRKWNLNPIGLSFLTSPTSVYSQPYPTNGNLNASALDEDDKTLFFLRYGAQLNAGLYDINGVLRATIPSYTSATRQNVNGTPLVYNIWSREMAVVPVPGACKQFFVFYVQSSIDAGPGGCNCPTPRSVLLRLTVDCNGSLPAISNGPTVIDESMTDSNYGIAVSRKYSGTRWLYYCGSSAVNGFPITASGTGTRTVFYTYSTLPSGFNPVEVDISPDGTKMAIASPVANVGSRTFIADVSTTTGAVTNVAAITPSGTSYGVEFSPDSKRLYISGTYPIMGATSGIYYYTVATAQLAGISGSSSYSQTALELGIDGLIYAAQNVAQNTNGQLTSLNPSTNTLNAPNATLAPGIFPVPSYCNRGTQGNIIGFALPDQIDGEDYSFFFDTVEPKVQQLVAGGQNLAPLAFRNLYTCQSSIPLTATLTNVANIRLSVQQCNVNGAGIAPPGLFVQTAWMSPTTSLDLLTLFGSNFFVTNPGTYILTYEGRNTCLNVRRATGLIRVIGALTTFNFRFLPGNEVPPTLAANTSVTTPAQVGGLGGAIEFFNVTAGFDSYQATVEQFNGGGTYSLLGTSPITNVSTSTTQLALNDVVQNALGYSSPNYFAQPSALNQIYRLSISLQNICGSSSVVVGHFQPVSAAYRSAPGSGLGVAPRTTLSMFPNPATTANVQFHFDLPTAQTVQVRLVNLTTGRPGPDLLPRKTLPAGPHALCIDLSALPTGMYMAELLGEQPVRLRFAKSE